VSDEVSALFFKGVVVATDDAVVTFPDGSFVTGVVIAGVMIAGVTVDEG
jgi:hypothetical protein